MNRFGLTLTHAMRDFLHRNLGLLTVAVCGALVLIPKTYGMQAADGQPSSELRDSKMLSSFPVQMTGTKVPEDNASSTVTTINLDGTIKLRNAQRLGINLGGQTFYDSGQIMRNLIFRNPGFEGEVFRTILHCAAVTATSCTDTNQYAVWPANFVQGASFNFIYGKAAGATGTVTSSTAASYSSKVGVTITFAALSPAPAVGDFVEVQLSVPGNAQAGWWPTTSGGATLSTEYSDLSPETVGKQALRMTASASANQTAEVASYFDSYPGHSFIQLQGGYQLSFRAKGVGGHNQLGITFCRQASGGNRCFFNQTAQLSQTWQDYSFNFNASEPANSLGTIALKLDATQSSVLLDDVSLTPAANSQNLTVFRDEVVNTLKTLRPGIIRYEDSNGSGLGNFIDNAIAPPFARVRTGFSEQETERDELTIGLHEVLQLCQAVGAEPWYNVPVGVSPAEMQNLIEYLAGAPNTKYGAKRAALGQYAPWTTVFGKIHLELGNEAWNDGTFHGASIPDPVAYGKRAATIFAAARSSASYSASSFDLILGSWAVLPWYTSQEMANSGSYDTVDAAPYLFYNFNDSSSNEAIFGPMFAQPESIDSVPTGYMYQQAAAAKASGASGVASANLAVYETNLSTQTGTASQSMVNSVVPSIGAGLTVVDHMLLMMRDLGVTVQNLWSLPEYANSFQNTQTGASETSPLFGAIVDMGGQSNLQRPVFQAEELANLAIMPDLLNTQLSGANPTWNQPASSNDNIQMNNAHYLQSFAFSDGGSNRSLVIFNLSRTQSLPVTTSGPGSPTGAMQIYALAAPNITDTNEASQKVQIFSGTVSGYQPGQVFYLYPYSMVVVKWTAQ